MSFILETNITQSRIWYTSRVDLIVVMAYLGQVLVGDFKKPGFLGRVFKNVQNWRFLAEEIAKFHWKSPNWHFFEKKNTKIEVSI